MAAPWAVGLAAVGVLLAGCQEAGRQPIVLRPLSGDPSLAGLPMFRVRVVRLMHRLRPDAPAEDIWRLLGATNVPYEKRRLWGANDLRLGDGARLAAERMNELLAETPDRVAHVTELTARENFAFRISLGGDRDALDIVWSEADGALRGRHFENVRAEFRVVCRSDPDDPAAVRLALVPEVNYGKETLRYVRVGDGVRQRITRRSFTLADLAAEVRLVPGRLLVIGATRASGVSVGGALFWEQRGPDVWVQTLIITADRLQAARMPEGTTVPFHPGVGGS